MLISIKRRGRELPPAQPPGEAECFLRLLYCYCIEFLRDEKISPIKQSYM